MHTTVFDTLHYANKLKQAGVPAKHAEAQAEAMAEIMETQLCTKQDLLKLKYELKHELLMWVLGLLTAQATIIISCLKLIH